MRTTSGGVRAGASSANQPSTSKPSRPPPVSATVGTSGIRRVRFSEVTASGRSDPLRMCGVITARFSNIIGTRPESRSGITAPVPL